MTCEARGTSRCEHRGLARADRARWACPRPPFSTRRPRNGSSRPARTAGSRSGPLARAPFTSARGPARRRVRRPGVAALPAGRSSRPRREPVADAGTLHGGPPSSFARPPAARSRAGVEDRRCPPRPFPREPERAGFCGGSGPSGGRPQPDAVPHDAALPLPCPELPPLEGPVATSRIRGRSGAERGRVAASTETIGCGERPPPRGGKRPGGSRPERCRPATGTRSAASRPGKTGRREHGRRPLARAVRPRHEQPS